MKTLDLARLLGTFQDAWNPRIVGSVNGIIGKGRTGAGARRRVSQG